MKNLRRTQNTKKQNITYIFILLLLVIFFATIGFRLIINASLFLADFSDNQNQRSNDSTSDIIITPELLDVPDATNSARIVISGTAEGASLVKVYVNDDEKEVSVKDDEFATAIKLSPGNNTVYLITEDKKSKQTRKSENYSIYYSNEKPELEITEPQNDSTVNTNDITVRGKTDEDITVKINNAPAIIDQEGNFSLSVRLKEGDNEITITAQDRAGNTESLKLKVRYSKEE